LQEARLQGIKRMRKCIKGTLAFLRVLSVFCCVNCVAVDFHCREVVDKNLEVKFLNMKISSEITAILLTVKR
jgi:hypothetical protein